MDKDYELKKKAYDFIEENKELVGSDYYRLKYHIMPPLGLLNDPNGFIDFKGEYHVFFQWNPFDTSHGTKYWGHVKSRDLVNWQWLPIGLAPSEYYEAQGCYSGSAIDQEGIFTLIYTGNVKNKEGKRESYQCIATSEDGVNFIKSKSNPIMKYSPEGYTTHFRDPKVWNHKDHWYMVIGTQTINLEGRVLLFKSKNLLQWSKVGEVTGENINGLKGLGYMMECPDMFSIGGKDILLCCPQGMKAEGDWYNNIYQAGYFVGKLDYESGKMNHGSFVELDRGFEFYAPQTMEDHKGRRILIGWMGLPEEENHPTKQYKWIHAMTMPRVLKLIDDKIYQQPPEELKKLRRSKVEYRGIILKNEEIALEGVYGDIFELEAEFENINAEEFGIKLRCSEEEKEETLLYFSCDENKIVLDRNNSGNNLKGIRKCAISKREKITFRIFSDTSSLEIFINHGEEVFTSRIFPSKNSKNIKFFSIKGNVKINFIEKWRL